jgi:hypothetical protein
MNLTRRGEIVVAVICIAVFMTAVYAAGVYAESFAVHP